MDSRLLKMIELTDFLKLFDKYKYAYFTNGNYNLNIIGIRNLIDGTLHKNTFDDAIVVEYKKNGEWIRKIWAFTTDPGQTSLNAPSNSKGTAILVPALYRSTYKLDLHNGKYTALCQRLKPVAVYRDGNKDDRLNFDSTTIDVGMYGINIHRAKDNAVTELVNGWSAGCLVFLSSEDFNTFMQLCREAEKLYGNSFSYTLITSDMLTNCVCN